MTSLIICIHNATLTSFTGKWNFQS